MGYPIHMKILITALNSKYIHTSLAVWYLKAACEGTKHEIYVYEATINDSFDSVLSAIYIQKPDIAAFSCYIWNMGLVLKLTASLRKILPGIAIVLGGPEVSYDSRQLIQGNPQIDYIIAGEGESSFKMLLDYLTEGLGDTADIEGLYTRTADPAVGFAVIHELSILQSPYTTEMLRSAENRIVYFESSRGCPYSCSYCLSSTTKGVRYFPVERVRNELLALINSGARQVKFVDRTFNCNRERAKEIFRFIKSLPMPLPNFHFEAAADLFDDEMFEILSDVPAGLFQFEIGIQSLNEKTLEAVGRKTNLDKSCENIMRLRLQGNCHIHLDLIAGLPFEDLRSFKDSFDKIYALKPDMLQLGFLKLLKGSRLRAEAPMYSCEFNDDPPYEILSNKYLSYNDLILLKQVEEVTDRFHNSGKFRFSLEFLVSRVKGSPFELFSKLSAFLGETGFDKRNQPLKNYYSILKEFGVRELDAKCQSAFNEILKLDFLAANQMTVVPEGIERTAALDFKEKCFEFLRDKNKVAELLPQYAELPSKEIFKYVHFETFQLDIQRFLRNGEIVKEQSEILFDYSVKSPVTGLFRFIEIQL